MEQRLFGRKSERGAVIEDQQQPAGRAIRRRGQQRGAAGHGRKSLRDLPVREELLPLPSPHCPGCGQAHEEFPGTEASEVLEIEVQAYRRVIRRRRHRPGCRCRKLPGIVTAPPLPRLIERGKFGISVWVDALLDKFLYGRASTRWIQAMADRGLPISAGSLSGGVQVIAPLFAPLYQALLPRLRAEPHWHADETRWEVFVEHEGKVGHRWYLWVFQSATVPKMVLAGVKSGVISCDRHSAYKKFARLHPGIVLCFCWAHQRRDLLKLANEHPPLCAWAMQWVDRIGQLFDLYEQRGGAEERSGAYRKADQQLHSALRRMARERTRSLRDPELPQAAVKLLQSMQRHWQGLREFVRHRHIAPDNNAAERALRVAVVGRKNFYGSGSEWSGQLAAMMFSLLMTMKLWKINPRTWLSDYLHACAAAGNRAPVDLSRFPPWSMGAARLAQLRSVPCENTQISPRQTTDTS